MQSGHLLSESDFLTEFDFLKQIDTSLVSEAYCKLVLQHLLISYSLLSNLIQFCFRLSSLIEFLYQGSGEMIFEVSFSFKIAGIREKVLLLIIKLLCSSILEKVFIVSILEFEESVSYTHLTLPTKA